jgi:hypothetical protein
LATEIAKISKNSQLWRPLSVYVYHSCVPPAMPGGKDRAWFAPSLFLSPRSRARDQIFPDNTNWIPHRAGSKGRPATALRPTQHDICVDPAQRKAHAMRLIIDFNLRSVLPYRVNASLTLLALITAPPRKAPITFTLVTLSTEFQLGRG